MFMSPSSQKKCHHNFMTIMQQAYNIQDPPCNWRWLLSYGALLSCLKRADNPSLPLTFSLGQIKQIKATLGVTINDVITGAILLGNSIAYTCKK
uniref:Uncharacterized protein n=1 Tax=Salix viminalis TaxID=40686 RepID=A0A6N2K927_SALVM